MIDIFDDFRWRGMLQDATDGAADHLLEAPRVCYVGFDPTASSLHVGHLLPIMGLVHLQRAGHHPIALVGGGTGLIGDPSGKSEERVLLDLEQARLNASSIHAQLEHFLDFETGENPARMEDNYAWLGTVSLIEFLRDVGKHFSVNAMLRKESVRRRIDDEAHGISFTEFSYQLLQAYDFVELHRRHGCTVQAGGSDQWGNITVGTELVRRMTGAQAFGITFPLLTTSTGAKFGKTESGAVWLDPDRTSPFRFYQFWINSTDEDVVRYLRLFTLLGREEIAALDEATREEPHRRAAQTSLAEDVTRRVHGDGGLDRARRATEALFGGDVRGLSAEEIADIFSDVPSSTVTGDRLAAGQGIVDLLQETELATSRGDARRSIEGGGIYVNSTRVESVDRTVSREDAIDGRFLVLRKGKKRHHLVEVVA